MRTILRKAYYLPIDVIDRLRGRSELVPPRSMIFVGEGDFEAVGREFLDYFIRLGKLQPDEKVLDVGCGIGRMAVPLTKYISSLGEYHGFEVVKKGIDWCQKKISSKFSNFHFSFSDVCNKNYNPKGKYSAADYRFPYQDGYFDFVFLTSVFTHMLPEDMNNYFREIKRVLKPGGRCLMSYFLINAESDRFIKAGASAVNFAHRVNGCLTTDKNVSEKAIAYSEDYIKGLYEKNDLKLIELIQYGSWCGRDKFLSFQDIVIAVNSGDGGVE